MRDTRETSDDHAERCAIGEKNKGGLGWARVMIMFWERGVLGKGFFALEQRKAK